MPRIETWWFVDIITSMKKDLFAPRAILSGFALVGVIALGTLPMQPINARSNTAVPPDMPHSGISTPDQDQIKHLQDQIDALLAQVNSLMQTNSAPIPAPTQAGVVGDLP